MLISTKRKHQSAISADFFFKDLLRQPCLCFVALCEILFSVLLSAIIICIVGENKENKMHEYVPVNWVLSVQAELGIHM